MANLLDLLLEGRLKELEQEIGLTTVGGVVVQAEDHRLHELGSFVLWHLEDEPGQVDRLRLQAVEGPEMQVCELGRPWVGTQMAETEIICISSLGE